MIEIQTITNSEKDRDTSAKHKWYLKHRHGMIRSLLVQDYQVHQIMVMFSMLTWTTLVGEQYITSYQYTLDLIILAVVWGAFTYWS